ncbi:LIM/homeobox protein Lhx3 [Diplogelasinospora grovesii]|uniref:LIM/homeobox protein Lhx3 n=1 Tax=Diplogelasinospora grovesii TaxID=303347 RepID=A0AAN6S9U1_9PEZI|nr:LIM/homeobox protein Lhx3 [Diplogelasinospora grovesii]
MDMEFVDLYRRPYSSGLNMHNYSGHQHSQYQGQHRYPVWNHQLIALYQQHQQRQSSAMTGQGNTMHASKQTEPKPRLAKDEVELLEREFAKNPKPSSSTKRELAEQMGVEIPRINNWFQNRRAKEKQMRKTAEFEAQQAQERSGSESKSPDGQEQGAVSEFYGLSNHHQPLGLSTAAFGEGDGDDSDDCESDQQQSNYRDSSDPSPTDMAPPQSSNGSPDMSGSDGGFVHVDYSSSNSPTHHPQMVTELAPAAIISDSFGPAQHPTDFLQHPKPYSFGMTGQPEPAVDNLQCAAFDMASQGDMLRESDVFGSFPGRDYFPGSSVAQFPSQMIAENALGSHSPVAEALAHQHPAEVSVKLEQMSPPPMSVSPPAASDMRFKSPPPPADIAGRRNMRRPAPLGLAPLRNASLGLGPKTGIDAPRRSDAASPMRRISSATGMSGRIQKSFMSSNGPRSPFTMDRNKEALLQNLQSTRSPVMASLNSAMSPMSPEGMCGGQRFRENTAGTNASDEDQGYTFGSLGAVRGLPYYKVEPAIKSPPGTPGLPLSYQEQFYANPVDQAWSYVQQDEPLPTPSLCSHQGSELEFSMTPHLPGYVASQPVTPSFPPAIGPTYGGFFGHGMANAEYNFPDSYAPESSVHSSPGGPSKPKQQFQFAQNVTPQDFHSKE